MKQTINNFSTLTSFFYLYSSPPTLNLLADKNAVFGSSSVWAQEVCHWVNLQSLLLHICHSLRKYYPRKIHQHNTSAPKYTAHLACKRVKETNEMQKVIYTEVSKWVTKLYPITEFGIPLGVHFYGFLQWFFKREMLS